MATQQLSEERVQFRVRKTIFEMLKDRGYDTGNAELEETFEDFQKRIESGNTLNIITYKSSSDEVDNPEAGAQVEPIYVHFMEKDNTKIDKDFVTKIVRFMDDWSTKNTNANSKSLFNTILIVRSGATAIARKSLAEIAPFKIEIFC